jgi:hypothetical protein
MLLSASDKCWLNEKEDEQREVAKNLAPSSKANW